MRRASVAVLSLLAVGTTLPIDAHAAPRGFPGAVFNMMTSPFRAILGGVPRVGRPSYRHRRPTASSRARTIAPAAAVAATAAAAGVADQANAASQRGNESRLRGSEPSQLGHVGPETWPTAYEDVIGFALWPTSYDDQLRGHGISDVLSAVFAPPSKRAEPNRAKSGESTEPAPAAEAVSSFSFCGGDSSSPPEWPAKQIEQSVQLAEPQRAALDRLRTAVGEALSSIKATCRDETSLTPIERLQVMQRRLWAVHDAAVFIRKPLVEFFNSLSDEQKKQFVVQVQQPPAGRAAPASAMARREMARMCGMPTSSDWPMRQIERTVRPTKPQRESLETLQKTAGEMGQMLMASCLQMMAETPPARLDTALDRLTSMLYAASTVSIALNDFYGQLSDDQKTQFNSLIR